MSEKLAEISERKRGVTPSPLKGRSVAENGNLFAENGAFPPKQHCFGPIFDDFS